MNILPAIDLKDGQVVRLYKGDFGTVHQVAQDPLETARRFAQAGAVWVHMVDLDGAKDGVRQNSELVRQVAEQSLTVAKTEALVEQLLAGGPPPPRRKPTFIVKDVRLFLNTITHSLDVMRSAGVDAQCSREDREEEILLTIHIPRRTG